jgi:non-specific serine/threonine protein kinase
MAKDARNRVGQQLGNYRLLHLLGRGGFADVYLGEHVYLKNYAALKILHTVLKGEESAGFLKEAQMLASLLHPHIVRVLDYAVEDGLPFLVMEYAPSGTLRSCHPKGTCLEYPTIVSYVEQVASALQYAHDRGIIHRDVKPENMLLNAQNELLLSDFGLAQLLPRAFSESTQPMERPLAGTASYLAPEQLHGKANPASDQYALGVVVYEWFCGEPPFRGSFLELAAQHLSASPASLRTWIPNFSPAVEEVVFKALAKEPEQRFARIQDFATALTEAVRIISPALFVSPAVAGSMNPPDPYDTAIEAIHENMLSSPPDAGTRTSDPLVESEDHREAHAALLQAEPMWKMPVIFTPLVGREQDVEAICTLLKRPEVRLLTLLGTGGIGKTRLSIQVATAMRKYFTDGACFVHLGRIIDAEMMIPTLARELGLQESGIQPLFEQLKNFLGDRRLLLVLDNFEQVVKAGPQVEELLAACPSLKAIITSRAALRLSAEYLFPVPPLSLPDIAHAPEHTVFSQSAAVALFVQRAQAIQPSFQITPANARAIAEICLRLDGLPLAIELAAARVNLFSPQALLKRLSQRLLVLTGGRRDMPERQQTLRNALKWSYDLLDAFEQRLFRRLSVFIGGWTLDAVEVVWEAGDEKETGSGLSVLDGVASLLDKSLLLRAEQVGEEPRLIMLETIREYGLECLQESGEAGVCEQAHAVYYLALLEEAEPHLQGPEQLDWFARLEQESANIFAALEEAYKHGLHRELARGANAFARFLIARGLYAEAEIHLTRARQVAEPLLIPAELATILFHLGEVAEKHGDYTQAETYLQEALSLARQVGDRTRTSDVLRLLGIVSRRHGDYRKGERYLQEAFALAQQSGDQERICAALRSLGAVASELGDYDRSVSYLQKGLALARKWGSREHICALLTNLGQIALLRGQFTQAETYMREALELANQIDYREGRVVLLSNLGHLAGERKDYVVSERYSQEALVLARQSGDREWIATLLANIGWAASGQEDYTRATTFLQEALALGRQINHHWLLTAILCEWGELQLKQKQFDAAIVAFKEARDFATEGNPEYVALACYGLARAFAGEGNIAEARRLGLDSLASLGEMGHARVAEIQQWLDTLPDRAPEPVSAARASNSVGLTEREIEVLRLLAKGMTNSQIAAQLIISSHTVNAHVRSIFNKLEVNSRSAATRYAAEHHLL